MQLRNHQTRKPPWHTLYFRKAANKLTISHGQRQNGGTLKAIKQVIKDGLLTEKSHQCSKYRNNLIEQDHRLIKRVLVKSSGFQSL